MNTSTQGRGVPPPTADRRIPVTLLTGFLGAGKTTLLNHLLRHPDMAGAAVLINEFGEVGIDHHLVDRVDETMMILDSGCICCSVQGDLVKALRNLAERSSRREIPPVSRVVIETTGLADPVPVVYTLTQERFVAARYRCDGVLTAVAATHAVGQLERHQEALRQVAMADRLLITKGDLATAADHSALDAKLTVLNPAAQRIAVEHGRIAPDALFGCGIYSAAGKLPDVAAWLGEEHLRAQPPQAVQTSQPALVQSPALWRPKGAAAPHAHAPNPHTSHAARHDRAVRSFVVRFAAPVPWYGFAVTMGRLLRAHGAHLLRVKGLMNVAGDPAPRVIHCVQEVAYPPLSLDRWPEQSPFADRCGRLVFIVRDLAPEAEAAIQAALAADLVAVVGGQTDTAVPLPTLCWLAHHPPAARPSPVEVDGWVVQPRRLRAK